MQQNAIRGEPIATTGALAFMFTDIAGSTRMWERWPSEMTDALERHDAILRAAIEAGGTVVKTTGDGMMAVFETAADGVAAGLAAQQALTAEPWGVTGPLRVRMAIHAGDAERRGNDYFGPTVNRTARLMAAGHGGQVLLSGAAAALAADRLPAGVELRDLGEFRLRDLGRPERVFQLVAPGLDQDFPPLTTLDQGAASLPTLPAAFVGRRVELEAVEARLADPSIRLLTLTGPGGTGKTSLAIKVAAARADQYRDGVAFVDLSAAREADALLLAVGRAIGVGQSPDRPLREAVVERLRDRHVLVVLDNFEQVISAAPVTAELLDACPDLTLLVTSREPLHVRAEHIYPVPPLGVPKIVRGPVSAEQIDGIESVLLFVDRARAVRPDFAVTDDNAAAVAEICRRLDGLPLAIELAAARLRLFSPLALRDRLGSRLDLLRSPARDLPERQQTLRATIEWSYLLLTPGERRLFERLAVFADADLRAIESVVAATSASDTPSEEPAIDALEALASLIEKSLLRQVDVAQGEPRVLMLETIREYATDVLGRRPEADAVRRAHAAYYADLVDGLRRELVGIDRDRAIAVMSAEVGNFQVAWRYWVAAADLDRLTVLAEGLLMLNEARGWYHDTVVLTSELLQVLAGMTSTPELANQEIALRIAGARALMATRGLTPEAIEAYTRTLDLFESGGAPGQHYSVLRGLGNLYILRAEFDKANELGRRILELAERERDPSMLLDGHLIVGSTMAFAGQPTEGLDHLEMAIDLFESSPDRVLGSRFGNDPRVACLTTSAFVLLWLGYPDRAVERADAAIAFSDRLAHPYTAAFARHHAALVHLWRQEPEIAVDRAVRMLEIADEYDYRIWSAVGSVILGAAQAGLGQGEAALVRVRDGLAAYKGMVSPPVFWPMLQYVAASAYGKAGQPTEGIDLITSTIELMGGLDLPAMVMADLLVLHGDLLAAVGSAEAADVAWRQALGSARRIGFRMAELRALTRLVRLTTGPARATLVDELRAVRASYTEGLTTADLREADAALG